MCAKYTFYKNPPARNEEEEESLYAKVVSERKIDTDKLAEEIADTCSFSSGVVKGMLQALSDRLAFHLKYGETVELEGIGNFSVTLKTPKGVTDPKQIRAESLGFKNVVYRCSPTLKHRLKTMPLERAVLPKRKELIEEERLLNIVEQLKDRNIISSTDCMSFNQCSRYQALKDLKTLFEQDKLTMLGRGKQIYYVLRESWQKGNEKEKI